MDNEIENVRKALKTPKSLHINSVPYEIREAFLELANKKFAGNYAVTLGQLLEMAQFVFPGLYDHERRLSALERGPQQKKEEIKTKTLIGGRVIKLGGNQNG